MIEEGEQVMGTGLSDSVIMDDETGHKKRASPESGRPDDADTGDYKTSRPPVRDTGSDKDL